MRERLIINLKAQFPRQLKFIGPYSQIRTAINDDHTCTEIEADWQARITRQKILHLMLAKSVQFILGMNFEKSAVQFARVGWL